MLKTFGQTEIKNYAEEEIDSLIGRENETPVQTSARYHTQSTGQTKLKLHCIHCHLVMRLGSDAVFAKDTHHDDDDRCSGWRCESLQGGSGQA